MGKQKEADKLCHQIASTLMTAGDIKSNLTATQRKGLSFLKKSNTIAVAPFDKGQGFCTIERENLIKKAKKEFKNVTFVTPDNTNTFERKIPLSQK
jgi:hypothetical protein